MEDNYYCTQGQQELVKAKPETIRFLMNFSRSYKVARIGGMEFEQNLN